MVADDLGRYYKDGRIESKADFKMMCRKITHHIFDKESERSIRSDQTKKKIHRYVKVYLKAKDKYKKKPATPSSTGPKLTAHALVSSSSLSAAITQANIDQYASFSESITPVTQPDENFDIQPVAGDSDAEEDDQAFLESLERNDDDGKEDQ